MNKDINTPILQNESREKVAQKQMRILLVMFAPYRTVQMQIATLSAFLKKMGCRVGYLEVSIYSGDTFDKNKRVVRDEIEKFQPGLVAFSSYDMNYYFILECADFIKSLYPNIKTIVGGHHASLNPKDYMQNECIDYLCIGEGEYVLKDLLEALSEGSSVDSIMGLCSRNFRGKVVYNRARNLIENLDELPFIDRSIVNFQQSELDYLPMLANRGCPFVCTYCANDSMKKLYPNPGCYVRYRSPKKIIEEIEECKKVYKFKYVYFYDDIFALDCEWLEKFADIYMKHFPDMPFYSLLHPSMAVSEKRLKLLHNSGCHTVLMGVESGSQKYRQEMLKRKITNRTILEGVALIKKHKMKLCIFMMVGLPDESLFDMLKSLWLNFRIGADAVQTSIFYPIKNTLLHKYCLEHNLINEQRRKKIVVFTFDTCLDYGFIKKLLIILFKWLNSGTPIIRRFQFSFIMHFLRIQYRKWFKGKVDYK